MLLELVDSVGHRLPVVGAELLGTINHGRGLLAAGRRRPTVANIATTATVTANVARNLGVGADRKQPIIATTRSDRAVEAATAVTIATPGRCRRGRGQRRVGRGPVLKAQIFPDR